HSIALGPIPSRSDVAELVGSSVGKGLIAVAAPDSARPVVRSAPPPATRPQRGVGRWSVELASGNHGSTAPRLLPAVDVGVGRRQSGVVVRAALRILPPNRIESSTTESRSQVAVSELGLIEPVAPDVETDRSSGSPSVAPLPNSSSSSSVDSVSSIADFFNGKVQPNSSSTSIDVDEPTNTSRSVSEMVGEHVEVEIVAEPQAQDATRSGEGAWRTKIAEPVEATQDAFLNRQQLYEEHYQIKLQRLLSHIPDVQVGVFVGLSPQVRMVREERQLTDPTVVESTSETREMDDGREAHEHMRSQVGEWRERVEETGLVPQHVRVAVTVPQAYLDYLWSSSHDTEATETDMDGIRDRLILDTEESVLHVLPNVEPGADPYPRISVQIVNRRAAPARQPVTQIAISQPVGRQIAEPRQPQWPWMALTGGSLLLAFSSLLVLAIALRQKAASATSSRAPIAPPRRAA
ncbi:MAG: hypothetical protein QF805_24285, partial [Pirellulaceae bacterium]|nr:hypothetical protein [Pirellulaceae bacterium]